MKKTDNSAFYKELPALEAFEEVLDPKTHHQIPDDWLIAITDVVNSTKAIEKGDYKAVNTAGALAAMAISNAIEDMEFPFLFGGDGIVCLIPAKVQSLISDILYDVKLQVAQFFDLELRVGMIRVSELRQEGYDLFLGKHRLSKYYDQAIISGNGLDYAESLIKAEAEGNPYLIRQKQDQQVVADFNGFTCRWKDIYSTREETTSVIIKFRGKNEQAIYQNLQVVLKSIHNLFGEEKDYHPIQADQLQLASSNDYLSREATVLSGKKKGQQYKQQLWKARFESFVTNIALFFKLPVMAGWYKLNQLKKYQILSSDFKKYDGSLKLVINTNTKDRIKWETILETYYQKGMIYYGVHVSDRAIMTCLLHEGSEREVHFIDGADGGYALAAKNLKAQMEGVPKSVSRSK